MAQETQIYVKVEGQGGPSWRPVRASKVADETYRLLEGPEPGSGESWPFREGDVVRCRPFELTDHDLVLVAVAIADQNAGGGAGEAG